MFSIFTKSKPPLWMGTRALTKADVVFTALVVPPTVSSVGQQNTGEFTLIDQCRCQYSPRQFLTICMCLCLDIVGLSSQYVTNTQVCQQRNICVFILHSISALISVVSQWSQWISSFVCFWLFVAVTACVEAFVWNRQTLESVLQHSESCLFSEMTDTNCFYLEAPWV